MPAVAYTKALLQHPGQSPEENHLLDSRAIGVLSRSGDAKEGVDSFKERRAPKFRDTLGDAAWWSPWVCIFCMTLNADGFSLTFCRDSGETWISRTSSRSFERGCCNFLVTFTYYNVNTSVCSITRCTIIFLFHALSTIQHDL